LRRDVDEEALPVETAARRVAHVTAWSCTQTTVPAFVCMRYSAFVRIHLGLRTRDGAHDSFTVERILDLLEEERVGLPLLERVAEQVERSPG